MTSPNNSNKKISNDSSETDKPMPEKQNSLLAGIIERATKSGIGRKKLNPSAVESAVAKNMAEINSHHRLIGP